MQDWIINGPTDAKNTFLFAHGAGAGKTHEFMELVATGLGHSGIRVIRFNFPYMQRMLDEGKRLPPNRAPVLLDSFRQVIAEVNIQSLYIGGKSMGGRMASLLADENKVKGLILFGFPFHPVGKPEKLKGEHLESIITPSLLLQGERDNMGSKGEVLAYPLSNSIKRHFLRDGDHSFKPRKASGYTLTQNMEQAIQLAAEFIHEQR